MNITDLADLDLSQRAEQGAELEILNPLTYETLVGSDEKPLVIRLLGADSPTFKRAVQEIQQSAQNKRRVPPAEQERNTVNALARATVGWSDNWVWDGQPFPYTAENCRKLYAERPWLRTQVDEFIADRSAFFGKA